MATTPIFSRVNWMPRPCAVELHVRSYIAANVKLHGTSPWHLKTLVLDFV